MTTDDGPVAIRDIDVGDKVLAWDEALAAGGYYTVTAVWYHEDPVTVLLTVDGETIETTPEHPFLTVDDTWVTAGKLAVGDTLRSADGDVGVVEEITFVATPQVMYNLTVADAHTYVVGDGEWLVHNSCGGSRLTAFSTDPDDLIKLLGTPIKDTTSSTHGTRQLKWRSGNVQVRYESHITDTGIYNARHHGPHYHVEIRPDGGGWSKVQKLEPLGYLPGHGTGFLPGEDIPAALLWAMDK